MARRDLLHRSRLAAFQAWLLGRGWLERPPRGEWEVLRMRRPPACPLRGDPAWILVFDRNGGDHFSLRNDAVRLVEKFICETKGEGDE